MALMQAGVPIKKMVAGIAMGLFKSNKDECMIVSDMSGIEDSFGLMDFKIVGTQDGITAIQMDVKYKGGLTRDVFQKALEQARVGRLHVMSEMKKVMSEPNKEMSLLVPRVISFKINTDRIGAVIGSGGKIIREIIDVTKTAIDIEDDGTVKIFGGPEASLDVAVNWVKTLAGQIAKGTIFNGKIKKFAEFGMFVELVPGFDGLVHISNIPRDIQKSFAKIFTLDEVVSVEVLDYDEISGRVSLRLIHSAK
jgi:polyribonucleotide nucleotidyltransferase